MIDEIGLDDTFVLARFYKKKPDRLAHWNAVIFPDSFCKVATCLGSAVTKVWLRKKANGELRKFLSSALKSQHYSCWLFFEGDSSLIRVDDSWAVGVSRPDHDWAAAGAMKGRLARHHR